jgi:hypothetical protein
MIHYPVMTRLSFLALTALSSPLFAAAIDYSRDVQPILAEHCYHCHGPDAASREAKLRLDVREGQDGAFRIDQGITVIKPGSSKDSELISRLFTDDDDEIMPPPKSKKPLSAAQKETLKRWVEEGAPWGEHWAFVAPKRPQVPAQGNAIDAFIQKRLASEGLEQNAEAAPEKLIRRVTLDLTGIPPTPDEVAAFKTAAAESVDAAYSALVDRLLASPRYGERMVWDWLDAARYADTNGYQGDPTRAMWYWRDWVIEAFNKNMPYDQFTIEQLAGDLLPNPTQSQLIATGFHRNHMINGEGGRIAEESRVEYVMDRTETTGTVWMGLTLNCCRCHDHKFDPLSQKNYFQLSAFWNSIDETGANDAGGLANPVYSFASPEQQQKIDELKAVEEAVKKERDALEKTLRGEQAAWEKSLRGGDGKPAEIQWTQIAPEELFSDHGSKLTKLEDGSVLAIGNVPQKDDYVFATHVELGEITGFKLEVLPHESFTNQGPGRAPENGNFVLSEIELQAGGRPITLGGVSTSFSQTGFSAAAVFDGQKDKGGWALLPKFGAAQSLIFEAREKIGPGKTQLAFRLMQRFGRQHTIGRFKLYATTDNPALFRGSMPDKLKAILAKNDSQRSEAEKQELTQFYLDTNARLAGAKARREDAKKNREAAEKSTPRTMVMRERKEPRKTHVLVKGAYTSPAEEVQHGVPESIGALPAGEPKNRLTLAKWLVSPEHPLTARVTVNRLWAQFFGLGIVKSAEDFGIQGDKPTHPELLDWLSVEFRESGWDVKKLVRLMVTSATYRQSTVVPPGMAERDPSNKLLARGPRYRLPSWMLRDQALAISGLLVERVGGPPVKGYQPDGIWEDATFGQIKYKQDHGEALYRRSLYTFWRRIVAPPMFFDVANRQQCSVKNGITNTALHALVTLNDPQYIEAARAFAQRTLLSPSAKDDASRLVEMFQRTTARPPDAAELALVTKRLATLRTVYGQDTAQAQKLIAVGESKASPAIPAAELAAWTGIGALLLNLDETLSKE